MICANCFGILVEFLKEVFQFHLNMAAKVSMHTMKSTPDLGPSGVV